ncbi:MAG TPA: helix-turn-helix transcriptional regulator [Caulobacteraceae bacterium]
MKRLRAERRLSQEELAHRAGLHRTFIGFVERAETNISIDNIEKIAGALEAAVVDLFKGEGYPH